MATAISFRQTVALAGRFPLLAGVSFEIAEGEVVHLRGPNGAGKSSLLRVCAGLLPISGGSATVLGHDLAVDRESLRREVGLLGHASFLYDELSATENLRFALRVTRSDTTRISSTLDRLELTGRLATTPVARLSAGQRRRVALAALAARAPRLWLLDEPHAGLDERSRLIVDQLIGEQRNLGNTVLLVSHELEAATSLADRSLEIAGGQITGAHARPVALTEVDRGVA
jgi:heme ABC exporter ATP-binding subunit CcmA